MKSAHNSETTVKVREQRTRKLVYEPKKKYKITSAGELRKNSEHTANCPPLPNLFRHIAKKFYSMIEHTTRALGNVSDCVQYFNSR